MPEKNVCISKGCNNEPLGEIKREYPSRPNNPGKSYIHRCKSCYESMLEMKRKRNGYHPYKSTQEIQEPNKFEEVTVHTLGKYSGDKFVKMFDRVAGEIFA